jgi:lipoate-protein ligase A
MLYVDNHDVTDPRLNLALEEYLLRQSEVAEPLLLLYVNEPAVIIGRNQNVFEEIDPALIKNKAIHLVRRLSGGGTVYHDLGNLNYSFITPGQADLHKFERVIEPIICVLREHGAAAEFRGRSDIVVGDKKISGNAQYASRGRMFSHGTILYDTELGALSRAIDPGQGQFESRAVQSVRSSVRNIRELLPQGWTIADLKGAILTGIFGPGEVPSLQLSGQDWDQIRKISVERYHDWEWNIGRSPRFTAVKRAQYPGGKLDLRIQVEKGLIRQIEDMGKFFSPQAIVSLNDALQDVRYDADDLFAALRPLELELFPGALSLEAFVELIY